MAVAILLERYQDSSIDNPGLELLMFTIFAVEASPDVDICDELRLDKEARTGLWWIGLRAAFAVEGGGAEPKGGGTTKLEDEFIRKVLSQVAELYDEELFPIFPLWLGEAWWGPGGERVIWKIHMRYLGILYNYIMKIHNITNVFERKLQNTLFLKKKL